jgi:cytochrome P450
MFRIALGRAWALVPQKKYIKACRVSHEYLNYYIDRALDRSLEGGAAENSGYKVGTQPSLLAGLSSHTSDREFIRHQILQGMMASQETTSALLGNACFLLSRNPTYWKQLRLSVSNIELSDLDFDTLLNHRLIQTILFETLRLYPVFPMMGRAARQDTTLPVGGGVSQDGMVFVPKGTLVFMSYYALHRDPVVFGDDTEEFRPERWENIRPTQWEYMAFGGGNRECLGKQKVLVEAAYVLVRLAKRFRVLESRDHNSWEGELKLTCKSKNGCKIAVHRDASVSEKLFS